MRFLTCREVSTDDPGQKADGELLTHLAVVVGENMLRVAIGADDAGDLAVEAGLLLDLAFGALADGLTQLHLAAGQGPSVVVAPAVKQHPPVTIYDNGGCGRNQGV